MLQTRAGQSVKIKCKYGPLKDIIWATKGSKVRRFLGRNRARQSGATVRPCPGPLITAGLATIPALSQAKITSTRATLPN